MTSHEYINEKRETLGRRREAEKVKCFVGFYGFAEFAVMQCAECETESLRETLGNGRA